MDESVILSKSDRQGKISYDIPYMGNLKRNETNLLTNRKKLTDKAKELTVAGGEGIVREFGMVIYIQFS